MQVLIAHDVTLLTSSTALEHQHFRALTVTWQAQPQLIMLKRIVALLHKGTLKNISLPHWIFKEYGLAIWVAWLHAAVLF